ncbi:MAG: DegT/DnrJ/EryC1/StrS family aminotransferase [Candidatus Omnitrophica bacterium]|nr:DegT/DnrJ/EryC1/StrS family aminotransferase [Candidatus Omnitrophota bacterium]
MAQKKSQHVPFHRAFVGKEEIKAVTEAIESGWITMGPKTVEFEEKFRTYVGAKYALAVNSCTAALHLALEAIGIKEGDEVLVPAITFTATAEVVCYFKAKPVLVDVEPDTLNIDASKIEDGITSRTKAIIVVDYAGQPVDYDRIKRIAKKHKLSLIEDAAHTLPSWYKGKKVGTLADITCFSFYATKTLATGEGGMITTENPKWAERMKIMRLHGMNRDAWKRYAKGGHWYYEIVGAGYKYNTTDMNAALGLVQLKKLEMMWKKRQAIAEMYHKNFTTLPEIICPVIRPDRVTSWHLYVIKLALEKLSIDRAQFIEELAQQGISTSVHFIPLYRHPFYQEKFGFKAKDYPHSEWAYERMISLPIFPGMTKDQVAQVIDAVKNVIKRNRHV